MQIWFTGRKKQEANISNHSVLSSCSVGGVQMLWQKAWSSSKHIQLNLEGKWFTLPCLKAFSFFFPILYLNRWRAYLLGTMRQKHVVQKTLRQGKAEMKGKERRVDFHTKWKQLMRIVSPKQWKAGRGELLPGDLWTGFYRNTCRCTYERKLTNCQTPKIQSRVQSSNMTLGGHIPWGYGHPVT